MELATVQKPTIRAKIHLDYSNRDPVVYDPLLAIKFNEMDIEAKEETPMVAVNISHADSDEYYNLSYSPCPEIRYFEYEQVQKSSSELSQFQLNALRQSFMDKKFPYYLPATFLCKAQTGTLLTCTFHGYPVKIQCCSGLKSFEEEYNLFMKNFINNPSWGNNYEMCLEKDLLKENEESSYYIHGAKGRASIVRFIIDLMNNKNNCSTNVLLLLCLENSLKQ